MTVNWQGVLETYRCILSCRSLMPGTRLENVLNGTAVDNMKQEYEQLKAFAAAQGVVEEEAQAAGPNSWLGGPSNG